MNFKQRMMHLLWFTVVLLSGATAMHAQSKLNDVAVVVNPAAPVNDLTLSEARKIFRGDRQYWSTDMPIVLLVRNPPSRERDVILRKLYSMTESEFKQYWIAKIFRAEATTGPKIVYSNSMAADLVSVIPGAIAFMSAKDVNPNLKVVKIDGRLPGDPAYPLR
ncbi:MAG TPA: substrate-binding domain-containing protein [Terriglobales bacterium]|jgi:ABC-type phosphate transport system substrate-binding protein|nr:substrate-binding domain-containing protein [Terriglobales bacterium]